MTITIHATNEQYNSNLLPYSGVHGMDIENSANVNLVLLYDVLYVAGSALLLLLVVASGIRQTNTPRGSKLDHNDVQRPTMWIVAVSSWIALSISFCLLLGNQMDLPPPHGICLTQAIFVYSSPTLCVSLVFSLLMVF